MLFWQRERKKYTHMCLVYIVIMKFGTAIGLMFATPVIVILSLWSKDLIKQEYHTYSYEQKIDQVYKQFLDYGPEFMGDWWQITESYLQTWETMRTVFDQSNKNLYRDQKTKQVYMLSNWEGRKLITWADYQTFTPLFLEYTRDKNYIYYNGGKTIYDINKNPRWVGQYIVDDEYVYTEDQTILSWANPQTFELILMQRDGYWQGTAYYKDNKKIYTSQWILTGADIESFEVINMNYAKDKNHVYNYNWMILWADPQSFQVFSDYSPYSKDNNYVYIWSRILTGADVVSFELVYNYNGESYAKDKNTYRKWSQQIDLPLDVNFDDEYVYILTEDMKIPRHGRDPWDVYRMYIKGDI